MPAATIDVVIPIHGGPEVTERCLATLAAQTVPHRAIVVDNASPDDSVVRLRERLPELEILELGANRGYAAACNAGVAAGSGEHVVVLNNDVLLERDFLEQLLLPLDSDTTLGSAVPVLLRPGGTSIDNAGLAADPALAGFPRLQGHPAAEAGSERPLLLGPSGAAGAYRRAAFEEVGGFDERIFLYQEDLDLALRLRAAGWGTALAPTARGVHLGSATAGRRSARQRRHAGFARGYLLRRYRVLRGRRAVRALATEAIVVAGDAVLSRDLAAVRGRLEGWRAAAGEAARPLPREGIDDSIDLAASLRLRRADYALADAPPAGDSPGSCPCCRGSLTGDRFAGRDRWHGVGGRWEVRTCSRCGSGVTLPFVPEDELGRLYPAAYAPFDLPEHGLARLASLAIRRWQGYLALRTQPLSALGDRPRGRILDVGCGRGDLGETLGQAGWRVTGIDPSPEACAVAARRGIDARVGTLETVELEPSTYDAVSFQHSLEHVSDPLAALKSAAAALRPSGLLLITVPNFGGWQARRFRGRWYHLDLPRHRTHFTARGLELLLQCAGFEPVRTSTSSSAAGLPASVQYALVGRCLFPAGLPLRLAVAACWPLWPLARGLDAVGGGDVMHAVARREA